MDYDFLKPSNELVFDLINRDNPGLPFPLTATNCRLGVPVSNSDGTFRNSKVLVFPTATSEYVGNFYVKYRRLDLPKLFPGGKIIVDDYLGTGNSVPIQTILDIINQKYGTRLVAGDVTASSFTITTGVRNISAATACPAFTGTFSIDRRAPETPIDVLVPEVTSGLLNLPATDVGMLTYGGDFSRFASLLETFTSATAMPITEAMDELINYMGLVAARDFSLYAPSSSLNGFGSSNVRIIRYRLPNANVPEANSVDFNSVAIIYLSSGTAWFTGRFLLHYNI